MTRAGGSGTSYVPGRLRHTPKEGRRRPKRRDRSGSAPWSLVSHGGEASAWGWCKNRWGVNWQITLRALTAGGEEIGGAFEAIVTTDKTDAARTEAA